MAVDIKYHKKPSQTFDKKKLLISPKKFPLTFQLKPFFKKKLFTFTSKPPLI